MIGNILTGAPVWVWPLLALLVFLGHKATKLRETPVILIYCLPLLGILSLQAVSSLASPPTAWSIFAIAYGLGSFLGFNLQERWLLKKEGSTVTLKGEWVTLLSMMTLFWMNFANGFMQATNPDLQSQIAFIAPYCAIIGLAAGSFLGRAAKVMLR
ncbi:MAG: hypothetical protein ABJN40_10905 [Sneathiella sp.]